MLRNIASFASVIVRYVVGIVAMMVAIKGVLSTVDHFSAYPGVWGIVLTVSFLAGLVGLGFAFFAKSQN